MTIIMMKVFKRTWARQQTNSQSNKNAKGGDLMDINPLILGCMLCFS